MGIGTSGRTPTSTPCPQPDGDPEDAGRVGGGDRTPCPQPDGDPRDAGRVSGGNSIPHSQPNWGPLGCREGHRWGWMGTETSGRRPPAPPAPGPAGTPRMKGGSAVGTGPLTLYPTRDPWDAGRVGSGDGWGQEP